MRARPTCQNVTMTTIGTSTLDIFPVALGGNTFGWTSDDAASHAVLDAFVDGGGNHIDTADGYSRWVPGNTGGDSERIIGSWLAARGNRYRDRVSIATKVGRHPQFEGLGAIAAAADASLARLGTDHIDLYYAHYDEPERDIDEIAAAFDALVTAGKVRAIGVSNVSPERIDAWMASAAANGFAAPVALQPHYNLLAREPYESTLAPLAARHGLGVFTYYSLASGLLTGKYRTAADFEGAARSRTLNDYGTDLAFDVVATLTDVASQTATTPTAVALAWLRSKPAIVAPIASASRVEQVADLLAGGRLQLSAEQLARLDAVSGVGGAGVAA